MKKNCMIIKSTTQIIREGLSHDILNNIIDITDLKGMWEKLQIVYSQVA